VKNREKIERKGEMQETKTRVKQARGISENIYGWGELKRKGRIWKGKKELGGGYGRKVRKGI